MPAFSNSMPKLLIRIVAVLLVACIVLGEANGFAQAATWSTPRPSTADRFVASRFEQQAIVSRLTSPFRPNLFHAAPMFAVLALLAAASPAHAQKAPEPTGPENLSIFASD